MSETIYKIYLSDHLSSVAIEEKKPIGTYLEEPLFQEEREQLNGLSNDFRKIEYSQDLNSIIHLANHSIFWPKLQFLVNYKSIGIIDAFQFGKLNICTSC